MEPSHEFVPNVCTLGGLLFTRKWNNMQYVTSATFSLAIYSDYLYEFGQQLQCPNGLVPSSELLRLAKTQVRQCPDGLSSQFKVIYKLG